MALPTALLLLGLLLLAGPGPAAAMRFTVGEKECLEQEVDFEGAVVRGSFVVLKAEHHAWTDPETHVMDLEITGPNNYHVHTSHRKSEDTFEFMVMRPGTFKFCFHNKNALQETVSFDVRVGQHYEPNEVAKDEHFDPLIHHLQRLSDVVQATFYECKWFFAQSERDFEISRILGRRLIYKTIFQAGALIGASGLQVYLLRRLFERKQTFSRV